MIPQAVDDKYRSVKQTVMGSHGDKLADLSKDTITPSSSTHATSDFGVKIPTESHDHWLTVTNGKQQGPALLEDSFGREKVSLEHPLQPDHAAYSPLTRHRSTASTMRESPSVLFTPAAPAPLANSVSTRVPQT